MDMIETKSIVKTKCSDSEMGFYSSTDRHVSWTSIRSSAREVVGLLVGLLLN